MLMNSPQDCGETDPRDSAREAGLRYVTDARPGITRRGAGKGFSYRRPDGGLVKDTETLKRVKSLAIPPAWKDVWICPRERGHIQATGRDARGRKQYRYHPEFRSLREGAKFHHIVSFARVLPKIRRQVDKDMGRRGLPREKVLATTVHLLETTLIRVGNSGYARENRSYGLTTLRSPHVTVEGAALRFLFKGKGGKTWRLQMQDRRVAKIVKACQELPGQELFQYLDEDGERRDVTSQDVNAYLREITGQEITAKDFRTWAGTVLAALALQEFENVDSAAAAKKNVRRAIERVAQRLGNTPTICRKCYVHPEILDCYLGGRLVKEVQAEVTQELSEDLEGLRPEEAAVLALLQRRLSAELEGGAGEDKQSGEGRGR